MIFDKIPLTIKLKKNDEANLLKELSKNSLANSEYWKKRFVSLNIY